MTAITEVLINKQVVWDEPPKPQRIGLVLGGGAARGIAHIGALQALEAHGIFPQYIAGTSVGALVGGLYAAGVSPARMVSLLEDIKWLDLVSFEVPKINWTELTKSVPQGILDLDKLIGWIEKILGGPVTFEQLNLPFAAVATDLLSSEIVVMNKGPLAPAIRASCSVPGIFTPFRRGGRLLIDGVVVNNLPISVVRDMGADYVVAVDLLPITDERQAEPRNLIETAMTALFMLARATQIEQQLGDVIVSPAIAHVNLADLAAGEELLEAGRKAMEAAIPKIQAALRQDR